MSGEIKEFMKRHYRHFNAATVIDASEAYCSILLKAGR